MSFDQLSSSLTIDLNLDTIFAEAGFIGTATVRNAVGVELTGLTLQWSASDPAFSVEYVRIDSLGRSTALIHIGTATGDFTIQAETDDGVTGSATVTVVAAPPAQGVTIDFETFPDGSAITCCIISTQFAAWGITFRWRDAFAGGGSGFPTLADYASPGFRALRADRRSTFEYLTGSHEMTFSVDIARFEVQVKLSTTAFPPPIRAYDRSGREIPGVVVERVVTVLGSLTFWELVIHAPVVIYRLKIGSTNGSLYLDDLVY